MIYLITYDLHKQGRNYQPVNDLLSKAGAIHPMGSVWLVDSTATTAQWRDALQSVVDTNDEVFVARLVRQDWASFGFDKSATTWLHSASRNW